MDGGMTRRRGYLWLCIAMLGAAGVLMALQPKGTDPLLPPASANLIAGTADTAPCATPIPCRHSRPAGQYPVREKKPLVFELNSADSMDLVQLYNIGPTMARRILKYRALLGGYCRKEQLQEVYGMDSARYADIAPHLTVDTSNIDKIDINTASVDQLKRHPYLDYYQAKAVVRLRDERGPYRQPTDLLNIPTIDTQTFKRIEQYLTCNSQPNK